MMTSYFCCCLQVVIAASIVFFQTAASATNIAGTAVALSGVLLYSFAKRSQKGVVDPEQVLPCFHGSLFSMFSDFPTSML